MKHWYEITPLDTLFFAVEPADDPYTLRTFVTEAPYDQKYDVFIQWVLRTGAFSGFYLCGPGHQNALHEMLADSELAHNGMAIILRQPEHLELLETLGPGPLAAADPLLFLVSVSTNFTRDAFLTSLEKSGLLSDPARITEVEQAWPQGEVRIEDGDRRVALVFPAERFSDREMGFSEKVTPSETQLQRYQEQFALLDWLFGREEDIVSEVDNTEPPEEGASP